MTKKTLAIILALAMIVAVTPMALANDDTRDGTGTIEFVNDTDPGIIDPDDPDDPDDDLDLPPGWTTNEWGTRDLNFGERDLRQNMISSQTYRTDDNEVPVGDRQNSLLVLSMATQWHVTVAVGGFFIDQEQTLENFKLWLIPVENSATTHDAISPQIAPRTAGLPDVGLTAGAAGALGVPDRIAEGTFGLHGFDFDGELFVPRGTAVLGGAKAEIVWTYAVTPTTP